MLKCKSVFLLSMTLAIFLMLGHAGPASAVPRPEAIQWRASPTAFVTSLYQGVLGRAPESAAVVNGWAQQAGSTAGSRKRLFWRFINSQEYRTSRWARLPREYNVYRRSQPRTRYWDYYAAKQPVGGHFLEGTYTFGVAMALVGYYRAFYPTW